MLATALAVLLAYLVMTLLTARVGYGIERSRFIRDEGRRRPECDPLERFRRVGHNPAAVQSFVYGLAWPLVVPSYCLYRCASVVITAHPPCTEYERVRRAEAVDARIRELERSLRRYDTT
ncbi:hypothetical protein QNO07_00870 [Streptomyces sp. 549]|uniref:hypothetical protein n=1 Tax=Streptomyces sp. 549 TaxID=3049076 RepID=UPI0024C3682E|nr:hypothetical protein [Streptomyces sp. 549]MDK1471991.1 hypothetical protein [Streptomyces sp. 549]